MRFARFFVRRGNYIPFSRRAHDAAYLGFQHSKPLSRPLPPPSKKLLPPPQYPRASFVFKRMEPPFTVDTMNEALQAALDELPANQREVFIAHESEGRSFKAMATESGVPMNTLLARKRYAMLHLRVFPFGMACAGRSAEGAMT